VNPAGYCYIYSAGPVAQSAGHFEDRREVLQPGMAE
jgi:hypothetical protein